MIKIITERPPNFKQIKAVFPLASIPNVIFAYHNAIYNPSGGELSDHIIAHEAVHLERQGFNEIESILWWCLYLEDVGFRYNEELYAHRAEYHSAFAAAKNRNHKRKALREISKKLAAPLYGNMVNKKQAQADILEEW